MMMLRLGREGFWGGDWGKRKEERGKRKEERGKRKEKLN
jgi:hypothetical protein